MDASNDTLVGKVFLDDAPNMNIPIFKNFIFAGKEKDEYKLDISNLMLEVYSQNDILDFGHLFLDLPEISSLLEDSKAFSLS